MVKARALALMAAAALVVGLFAAPGIAHKDDTEGNSFAEISLVDCVVESSKDISYVAFLDSGEELDKFDVNAPTYDLTSYDSIDDVDSVRVKSGQTVESFGVSDCADDTAGTDGDPADDSDDTTDDDTTGDDDATEPDTVESHNDRASANSQATITMSGCVVDSSKDISYVAFFAEGEQVDKIEDVDTTSYDLTSHEGIDEVDSVRVKAGTTIATFSVSCGTAGADDDTTTDDATEDGDATEDDATDDAATEDGDFADDDVKEGEDVEDDADDDIDDDEDQDDQDDQEDDEEA